MGVFDFIKKEKELTPEQIMDKSIKGTITCEDIANIRVINILKIAQGLLDSGDEIAAGLLAETAVKNRPSILIGRFVADNPTLEVEGMENFKYLLETEEERAVFCRLYREGYITNENIGEVTEEMQEKIDLAFDEEFDFNQLYSERNDGYVNEGGGIDMEGGLYESGGEEEEYEI